jgi:biopolymer transport protein ExbD
MRSFTPRQAPITKVNVTPIIDVALVLVIILLVTAPLLSVADLPVNLPQAQTRESEDEANLSITLSSQGELALDDHIVSRADLPSALRARLEQKQNENVLVVVRADMDASYGTVKELLEEARDAGARRIAIATRQRTDTPRPGGPQ